MIKEYFGYILLGISSVSLLGVGTYYVFFNEQPESVVVNHNQNETLKGKHQTKKRKPKKVVLDPVIDNIYWSIASFVIYGLIYLGLRYTKHKDQATLIIVLSIVLGKIGLAMFSSYFYQKNDFDQNLEKSFHPVYFINQNIEQIILSLVGYLGLAALVYFDRKKPEQQPIEGQQPVVGEQPIEQPGELKPKEIPGLGGMPILQQKINNQNEEGKKIEEEKNNNAIPNLQNHNQNEEGKKEEEKKEEEEKGNNGPLIEENKKNNEQPGPKLEPKIDQNANNNNDKIIFIKNLFQRTFDTNPYKKIITLLKKEGIINFEQVVALIGQSYQDGKISENAINNLISQQDPSFGFLYQNKDEEFKYYESNTPNFPLIDCFFFCLDFFFNCEEGDEILQNMVDIFLKPLMNINNDLNDQKIMSLQKAINEIFYFYNSVSRLAKHLFEAVGYYINSVLPADVEKIKETHLAFLDRLIERGGYGEFGNALLQQEGVDVNAYEDGDIKKIHRFLTNEKNRDMIEKKIDSDVFWRIFFKK